MELRTETKSVISSIMYTRLLEIWTYNKNTRKHLTSKAPTEQELDEYVNSIRHYFDIRHAYIEFCNDVGFVVDLQFEYPETEEDQPKSDEDRFYKEHCPDEVEETETETDEDQGDEE